MKENKKKKFHFHLPKLTPLNLILMILIPIILFVIIAIPVIYVNEYNSNKPTLFASDLENVNKKEIVYGNENTKLDFNFVLYCTNYDNASGTIKFKGYIYENENTRKVINLANTVKIRLGMYSDWIKVEQTSTSYDKYIATGPKTAEQSRSRYDFTIYNIPKLPKKGKLPFINVSSIPVYAYITYTTTVNGTDTIKRYILKYDYNDYVIGSETLEDNCEKELNVSSTSIQWRYKNDTSWTSTSIAVDDLIGIETRVSDTHIQWKRKCDTEWTNLRAFNELTGYVADKIPQVKIENGSLYWKYEDNTTWTYLMSISSLKSVDLQVNEGYIQWKRKNHTDWTNLIELSKLPNYNTNKTVTNSDVRVNGSNIQWKYSDTTSYTTLQTVDSLIGIRVQFDENRNVQWKCIDESDWKNLMFNNVQVTEKNITTPVKYGPTAGGK